MKDTNFDAPLIVYRTPSQKAGFLVAGGIAMAMALAITILFPLVIPQSIAIPRVPGDLVFNLIYLGAGPLILYIGGPAFVRAVMLPANQPIMEIAASGLVIHADGRGRRYAPPLMLDWADVEAIRTSSGSNGSRDLTVVTRGGKKLRLMPNLITPAKSRVIAAMLEGAKRAGFDTVQRRQFLLIASQTSWTLHRARR
ncbi:MAG: hypothetical protein AAFV31_15010 [Pseudomonadota bacterium]